MNEIVKNISKMGRKYNSMTVVSENESSCEVLKDVLTEKEKWFIKQLRRPNSVDDIPEMSQTEVNALLNKMDEYIEIEGKIRRAIVSFDEMYVPELLHVKDILKNMLK